MKLPQPSSVGSAVNVLMNLSAPNSAETPPKQGGVRFEDNLQQQVGTHSPAPAKAEKTARPSTQPVTLPADDNSNDGSSLPPEDQALPVVSVISDGDDGTADSVIHTETAMVVVALDEHQALPVVSVISDGDDCTADQNTETATEFVIVALDDATHKAVTQPLPAQPENLTGNQPEVLTLPQTQVVAEHPLLDTEQQADAFDPVKRSPLGVAVEPTAEADTNVLVSANNLARRQTVTPVPVSEDEITLDTNDLDAPEQLTLDAQPKSRPAAEAPNVPVNKSWLENLLAAPVAVDTPGTRAVTLAPLVSAELMAVADSNSTQNLQQNLQTPAANPSLASALYSADQRQLAAAEARQAHTQQIMTNAPSGEGKTDTLTRAGALQLAFGEAGWGERLGRQLLLQSAQGSSSAQIRLDPPELGSLTVRIQLVDQSAAVNFVSPHAMVRDALEQQSARLQEMFREQGIDLLDVSVSDQREGNTDSDRRDSSRYSSAAETAAMDSQAETAGTVRKTDSLIDYYA
jgi:flagellar hook-length control protein FliK